MLDYAVRNAIINLSEGSSVNELWQAFLKEKHIYEKGAAYLANKLDSSYNTANKIRNSVPKKKYYVILVCLVCGMKTENEINEVLLRFGFQKLYVFLPHDAIVLGMLNRQNTDGESILGALIDIKKKYDSNNPRDRQRRAFGGDTFIATRNFADAVRRDENIIENIPDYLANNKFFSEFDAFLRAHNSSRSSIENVVQIYSIDRQISEHITNRTIFDRISLIRILILLHMNSDEINKFLELAKYRKLEDGFFEEKLLLSILGDLEDSYPRIFANHESNNKVSFDNIIKKVCREENRRYNSFGNKNMIDIVIDAIKVEFNDRDFAERFKKWIN